MTGTITGDPTTKCLPGTVVPGPSWAGSIHPFRYWLSVDFLATETMLSARTLHVNSWCGGLRCGSIANKEQGNVIRLARATCKMIDRFKNNFLEMIERRFMLPGKYVVETRDAE